MTLRVDSKVVKAELPLSSFKTVSDDLGIPDLLTKWDRVAAGKQAKYADGVLLQRFADGTPGIALDVRVDDKPTWESVDQGVPMSAAVSGAPAHFEYVRVDSIVLITSCGSDYDDNPVAYEVMRELAAQGRGSHGLMTKVRNKRTIGHPRAVLITNPADVALIQEVVNGFGSKRVVMSNAAAQPDEAEAEQADSTAEPAAGPSSASADGEAVPPPDFDTMWRGGQWTELRQHFLAYAAEHLGMANEIAFLEDVAHFDGTIEQARVLFDRYVYWNADLKIGVHDTVATELSTCVHGDEVRQDLFAPAVEEVLSHLSVRYRELYLTAMR